MGASPIQPSSTVTLCKMVRMNPDYKHQMRFFTHQDQLDYFEKYKYETLTNFTYIKQEHAIKVQIPYLQCLQINYCFYTNPAFVNKTFFSFVSKVEYVSQNVTKLYLELDVFQTWQFDIERNKGSFIARQHTYDLDNYRAINIQPEGMEIGNEYEIVDTDFFEFLSLGFLISSTIDLLSDPGDINNPKFDSAIGAKIDKVASCTSYYICGAPDTDTLTTIMFALKSKPWITQGIQSITVIPLIPMGVKGKYEIKKLPGTNITIGVLPSGLETETHEYKISDFRKNFGDCVNNKMNTFPYSFIEITAYDGTIMALKPESIQIDDLQLNVENYIGGQPRMAVTPCFYNGYDVADGLDTSLILNNFPSVPVLQDNYMLYMANNASAHKLSQDMATISAVEQGVGAVGSLFTGNVGGAIAGGIGAGMTITKEKMQRLSKCQDMKLTPPSLNGQVNGQFFNISNGFFGITIKYKRVKQQFFDRIDKFFTTYGYAINDFGYLLNRTRTNFDYVEAIDPVVVGRIPQEDVEVLKKMFTTGVTLWYNEITFEYDDNKILED